ncbi:Gfo/Idh/MocA family protein [Kriegella aquimaris]|uniref:Oxidoreductase family, NAD-binding Rossmann fold n=1 Tax=Kriegella aquimaris TaxID=192904 RepID=A0A1G9S7A6_9FLAO|nr:Gfo/Idh/MocA family oxidoreductase [Kriegella aquimaris]SDM31177.1 Oxidoreductase family, NAD-binding Rossmann fold [Kriegella aquimaris]
MKNQTRRNFIKLSALSTGFLGLSAHGVFAQDEIQKRIAGLSETPQAIGNSAIGLKYDPIKQVRIGVIGVGNRGYGHVKNINSLQPNAKIVAIADVRESRAKRALELLNKLNKKKQSIDLYFGDEEIWRDMVKRDDIDLIVVVTPPTEHAHMAVYAMEQGKHVVSEVPIALTIQESWDIINTAEKTQRHCMMLENCCYGEEELWVLNMVKNNVFGSLTHAEGGYIHSLLQKLFVKSDDPATSAYYKQWRLRLHAEMHGNLYPTHGLGPIANYMDIGNGDRFDYLVSMDSSEESLHQYATQSSPDNDFYNQKNFSHGDMNSSMIKTAKGRSILLQHDVVSPRPYSRINALSGSKAYHEGYPSRLSLYDEGLGHDWLNEEKFKEMQEKYEHPIWHKMKEDAQEQGGHGGMDYIMFYRLIQNLNNGYPMDMNVYNGVDWSVILPLTKLSVELGSIPIKFPDFTRGNWKEERELGFFQNI